MKNTIIAIAFFALILASCGTNANGNTITTDSTGVQVDTVSADTTSTDTTIAK